MPVSSISQWNSAYEGDRENTQVSAGLSLKIAVLSHAAQSGTSAVWCVLAAIENAGNTLRCKWRVVQEGLDVITLVTSFDAAIDEVVPVVC